MAVSTVQLFGLGVLSIGMVLLIVGTATPWWMTYSRRGRGLFKECIFERGCESFDLDEVERSHKAVIALCLIGIILCVFAGVLAVLSVFWTAKRSHLANIPALVSMLLSFFSGAAIFVAIIVYGVEVYKGIFKEYYDLDYSFGLCIIGATFIMAGGVLICLGRKGKTVPNYQIQQGQVFGVFQQPHLMYQPQVGEMVHQPAAGGMMHQPQAEGMGHQPQAEGMGHQPQAEGMGHQPQALGIMHQPQALGIMHQPQAEGMGHQPQAGGMMDQPQAGGMMHQPQASRMMHQTQAGRMVYQEHPQQDLVLFKGTAEERKQADDKV